MMADIWQPNQKLYAKCLGKLFNDRKHGMTS